MWPTNCDLICLNCGVFEAYAVQLRRQLFKIACANYNSLHQSQEMKLTSQMLVCRKIGSDPLLTKHSHIKAESYNSSERRIHELICTFKNNCF